MTTSENLMTIMQNRRSYRSFEKTPLPDNHIDQILDAACLAPSKNRLFPYEITAITESVTGNHLKEELLKYAYLDKGLGLHHAMCLAPLLLIYSWIPIAEVYMYTNDKNNENARISGIENFSTISQKYKDRALLHAQGDIHISATYAMLMAESLGYQTHMVECFDKYITRQMCNINKSYLPRVSVAIGTGTNDSLQQNNIPFFVNGVKVGKINNKLSAPLVGQPSLLNKNSLSRKI